MRWGYPAIGAPERIRTSDLRFRKPLLYPLSYGGAPIHPPMPLCVRAGTSGQTRMAPMTGTAKPVVVLDWIGCGSC